MRRLLLLLVSALALHAQRPLTVFAAASLTDAGPELGAAFGAQHRDWSVRFSFGASSKLRAQIEQGAPADVFASADERQMEPLAQAGLVDAPLVFARNRLALALRAGAPIAKLQDLAKPGLRLVATTDAVPIGHYTKVFLAGLSKQAGFPAEFASQVEANIRSREPDVRALAAKVRLGEADAAFVYESDLQGLASLPLPAGEEPAVRYPAAAVKASPNLEAARAFVVFLGGEEAHAILRRHGFQ